MEDWKNTKCGTCIIQRQKPICNSCLGHQLYKPITNADKIRNMQDEELAEFLISYHDLQRNAPNKFNEYATEYILKWLQSEVKGSDV